MLTRLDWGRDACVIRLGGRLVSAHLLVDRDELTLIDAGLWGVARQLRRVVAALGRKPDDVRNLLLTHGHLDHVGGAAEIQAWSGARVWVHAADREHVAQGVRYVGLARGCGALEVAGRRVGGYRAPEIGGELREGERLPFWGGLRVWHLPGHTPGHCALVAERDCEDARPRTPATGGLRTELVFTGDLFASYAVSVHRPPFFLTRDRARADASLRALASTRPAAVLPSHYDHLAPALHAGRLAQFVVSSEMPRIGLR
ncbi:MAG: MBL fold metallo-hydrolase [Verrucomicrobia bacterium]|nr:MAG: MBL fold metallo-hydrolase [Verrucomicrobiota bacterium]